MNFKRLIQILWLVLLLAAAGLGLSGCGTEPDNTSARPWNSPEGWQYGAFPSSVQHPH
jgi:hypothetical protein